MFAFIVEEIVNELGMKRNVVEGRSIVFKMTYGTLRTSFVELVKLTKFSMDDLNVV